jgi:hypothetical protein
VNTSALQSLVDRLSDALCVWDGRDDTKPCADARRAANVAVDSIDGLLSELHSMRSALLSEIRVCDAANAARVDALLTRLKDNNTMATPLPYPYSPTLSGTCTACRADTGCLVPRNARWTRPSPTGLLYLCRTHKATDEAMGQRHDAAGIARARTRFGGVR